MAGCCEHGNETMDSIKYGHHLIWRVTVVYEEKKWAVHV
jgi:hypothetical protein